MLAFSLQSWYKLGPTFLWFMFAQQAVHLQTLMAYVCLQWVSVRSSS